MKPSFVPQPSASSNVRASMRRSRVFVVIGIFLFWVLLICGRLVWLQVVQHTTWMTRAAMQQQRTFQVAPRRGILYDRNLHELAMTVSVDSIYAVPGEIPAEQRAPEAQQLARILHTEKDDHFTEPTAILKRINGSRYFTWIARKQDNGVITAVRALHLKGVYFQKEFKRFYPENDIAAQVLGYVGVDDNGLGGVEQKFDNKLHGIPGRMLTAIDARRHILNSEERDPQPGANMVLTLDANIQFMAEQALDRAMERVKPLNGTVVVQDPHTGQILALAMRPTFDPNDVRHTSTALLRDHAVSDVYEPGSTFKLVTYSAALDAHVTTTSESINCEGGRINVAGRWVHDDRDAVIFENHHNNVITIPQALAESSDVAAVKLAERMGKEKFYDYIHAYGFGQRTGLELPGETRGLLKPPQRWQPTTIGSIPMGQEVGVTPIQLITMASTIANGGMYLPPHIVMEQTNRIRGDAGLQPATFHAGNELPDPLPTGAHRVISTTAAAQMRQLMQGVVLNGTGKPAQLNGYSAGGKTGTAQKIDVRTHTYSKTAYIASFVGFAPINNPAVTIAVIMDTPTEGGHHGTQASAPVFHELAQQILEYLGVPHDEPLKTAPELAAARQTADGEDVPDHVDDLGSLFAEVNNLPADDPLRKIATAPPPQETPENQTPAEEAAGAGVPAGIAEEKPLVGAGEPEKATGAPPPSELHVSASAHSVTVPDFTGATVRVATEKASSAGLAIEAIGSGVARGQAPAAGTRVPQGTQVVVQFGR